MGWTAGEGIRFMLGDNFTWLSSSIRFSFLASAIALHRTEKYNPFPEATIYVYLQSVLLSTLKN